MHSRRTDKSNIGRKARRRISVEQLKSLSYEEAQALLPSASSLPRDIYGLLDGARKSFPEGVTQQLRILISNAGEFRFDELVEVALMLSVLTGEIFVHGINHKGRFIYGVYDPSCANESIARAHQVHVLEMLGKRLLRRRRLDGVSILLLALSGRLVFTGVDRKGELQIEITHKEA